MICLILKGMPKLVLMLSSDSISDHVTVQRSFALLNAGDNIAHFIQNIEADLRQCLTSNTFKD